MRGEHAGQSGRKTTRPRRRIGSAHAPDDVDLSRSGIQLTIGGEPPIERPLIGEGVIQPERAVVTSYPRPEVRGKAGGVQAVASGEVVGLRIQAQHLKYDGTGAEPAR